MHVHVEQVEGIPFCLSVSVTPMFEQLHPSMALQRFRLHMLTLLYTTSLVGAFFETLVFRVCAHLAY